MVIMSTKPRAVIYIRVSDESQINNNSLKTQENACKQYLESKGYELARDMFRDEGFSAKHTYGRHKDRQHKQLQDVL